MHAAAAQTGMKKKKFAVRTRAAHGTGKFHRSHIQCGPAVSATLLSHCHKVTLSSSSLSSRTTARSREREGFLQMKRVRKEGSAFLDA
jgi:hypothetical protein